MLVFHKCFWHLSRRLCFLYYNLHSKQKITLTFISHCNTLSLWTASKSVLQALYCKTFLCCGSVFRCLLKWHWCVWSDFFVLENNVFFLLWKYLISFLYLCPVLLSAFTCALLYILNGHISNKLLPKINDKSLWTSLQNACHYVFISSYYVCKNGTDCQ